MMIEEYDEEEEIVSFRSVFSIALPVILIASFLTDFGRMEISKTDKQVSGYKLRNGLIKSTVQLDQRSKQKKRNKHLSIELKNILPEQINQSGQLLVTEQTIIKHLLTRKQAQHLQKPTISHEIPTILFWNKPYEGFSLKIPEYCPVNCKMKVMKNVKDV